MKSKVVQFSIIAIGLAAIWYLFFMKNDYQYVINVKTSTGTCFQSILDWNKTMELKKSASYTINNKEEFNTIQQSMTLESYELELEWNIKRKTDSIVTIQLGVKNKTNAAQDRIEKILGTSKLETLLNEEITSFNTGIIKHLDAFKVHINGYEETPEAYVAYINVICTQKEKAAKMIMDSPYINTFLRDNNIKLLSNPFLEINSWNTQLDQLDFNFCFPISKTDSFPDHAEIKYKKVASKKAIKATFNGNYGISDRAWYALRDYAKENKIELKPSITEIFYNNPHHGEDDMGWKAEAFFEINN